jgi:hypothetical protein
MKRHEVFYERCEAAAYELRKGKNVVVDLKALKYFNVTPGDLLVSLKYYVGEVKIIVTLRGGEVVASKVKE